MEVKDHEEEILKFWDKDKTFEKSLEKTKDGKPYIFYDGPPFATGMPHYGHLLASFLKDAIPRYFTMNGRHVNRTWGWDCHGLPIENIAEKELGINSKDEIEVMGIKKFNNFCRSKVLTYAHEWKKVVNRVGRWVDFDGGYKTMDNNYIESVWWAFKELHEKGYIYEGEKILMYCPRCSTPLAKSEITMDNSYKVVKDITLVAKFKIKDEDAYALAWTTTPWTLPSNLALTVNPDLTYSYVKDNDSKETYVIAKELVSSFYKSEEEYEIVKEVKGKELEGKKYEPLFPYFKDSKNAFQFILGDFVTAEDGTGIVHTAPAFGEDDYAICRKYDIPMVQPVDEKGNFTDEVTDFAGQYVHDANLEVVKFLKSNGQAVMSRKMDHEYPFCCRCDTKLIYRALPAWFVDIQKIKDRLLELNMDINWIPEFLKEGRMKHNITTAPDWNISRNRYWAAAIPVWKSESGKIKVIGSVEELKEFAISLPEGDIDLHKDYLDEVELEIDGEKYARIPEVLDCWFESGAMPFAQFHYPFENKEFFEENFPAQFVVEYIGQTRAWFYYMMSLSAILFDKIPFENVLTTGTILADDGSKMSKSKNNFTDPMEIIDKYGVDAMRFYLLQSPVMNADNFSFMNSGVEEIYKKVILLMYNVNRFYDGYKTNADIESVESDEVIDKWIIARVNELIKKTTTAFESYNTIDVCNEIRTFIDDLSTWYVRLNRDRFNEGDETGQKTLKFALDRLSKVCAPIMPFASEKIYQTLYGEKKSVHLSDWPNFDEALIDTELLENMSAAREIVSVGLRERERASMSLKQPLASAKANAKELSDDYKEIIKDELNLKDLKFATADEVSVELDINLTPELEAEGAARILSRQVQAFRKKLGLNQNDLIKTVIVADGELMKSLETQKELLMKRTNSESIDFTTDDEQTFKNKMDFRVLNKKGVMSIEVLK